MNWRDKMQGKITFAIALAYAMEETGSPSEVLKDCVVCSANNEDEAMRKMRNQLKELDEDPDKYHIAVRTIWV